MKIRILTAAALAAGAVVVFAPPAVANPNCTAWLGARDTGQCIAESNGGLPQVGFDGWGLETGPLLPGRSINIPLG